MSSELLRKIGEVIDAVLAGLKPKLKIKTPFLELELDGEALSVLHKKLRADRNEFNIMFDRCFISRDVYTAPLGIEILGDVQASAPEIRDLLNARVNALSGSGGDIGSPLHLLIAWAASAKRLGAVLRRRMTTMPADTTISADRQSAGALLNFRIETLPIIGLLICRLEDRTKVRAEESYATATGLLTARDVISINNAIEGSV